MGPCQMASKYDFLFPRAMDRTCKRNDMSDSSKRFEWSGNLVKQLTTMLLSKTADQLANPKTVLTWLMGGHGSTGIFGWAGWFPFVNHSRCCPQFLMAGWIRSKVYRKPVWLLGAGVQGGSVPCYASCRLETYRCVGWRNLAAQFGCFFIRPRALFHYWQGCPW